MEQDVFRYAAAVEDCQAVSPLLFQLLRALQQHLTTPQLPATFNAVITNCLGKCVKSED